MNKAIKQAGQAWRPMTDLTIRRLPPRPLRVADISMVYTCSDKTQTVDLNFLSKLLTRDVHFPVLTKDLVNSSLFLLTLAQNTLGKHPVKTTASASALARKHSELLHRITYQAKENSMHAPSRKQFILTLVILLTAIAPLSLVFSNPTTDGKTPPPPPPPSVTITLEGKQTVLVNGRKTAMADFPETIEKEAAKKGNSPLMIIDGDGDVPMGRLHKVQRHLRDLNLTHVSYRGEFQAAQNLVLPSGNIKDKLAQIPEDMIIHVKVDNMGIVTINRQEVAGARVPDVVGKLMQDNPNSVVILHTKKDTHYGAFVQVLGYLRDGGATRIAVADVN